MIKQNIYLFFEQNDDDSAVIDSKLVRLYMNRFIIEDDNQNEIIGVAHLSKMDKVDLCPDFHFVNSLVGYVGKCREQFAYKIFSEWRTSQTRKLIQDMKLISAALQKSMQKETFSDDIHFIIGSSFYMSFYWRHWFTEPSPPVIFPDPREYPDPGEFPDLTYPIEKLIAYIIAKSDIFNFGIDFACTFISGFNFSLCTKSEFTKPYEIEAKAGQKHAILSVNNDLESFYEFMMSSDIFQKFRRKFDVNQYQELFLFQLPEDNQKIPYLDALYYDHSNSVGVKPTIIEDPTSYQLNSKLLDNRKSHLWHHYQAFGAPEYFFPPIRDPDR